jgi:hypothetical protein
MSLWIPDFKQTPSCGPAWSQNDTVVGTTSLSDPTYLKVDLKKLPDGTRNKCVKYGMPECNFNMDNVRQVKFDVAASACGKQWIAPFWVSPTPWVFPQDTSGEIDMVENCHGNFNASFGSSEGMYEKWGDKNVDNLDTQTVTFTVLDNGDVTSKMCKSGTDQCIDGMTRKNYIGASKPQWEGFGNNFSIISDVWNGQTGDAGFQACASHPTDPGTLCEYTVSNVRFFAKNESQPVFQHNSPCSVMNAA